LLVHANIQMFTSYRCNYTCYVDRIIDHMDCWSNYNSREWAFLDLEDQRGSRLSMNLAIEQRHDLTEKEDPSPAQWSPALSRSLDVLVNLSHGG